jgi:hypothetical protein
MPVEAVVRDVEHTVGEPANAEVRLVEGDVPDFGRRGEPVQPPRLFGPEGVGGFAGCVFGASTGASNGAGGVMSMRRGWSRVPVPTEASGGLGASTGFSGCTMFVFGSAGFADWGGFTGSRGIVCGFSGAARVRSACSGTKLRIVAP